MTSPLSISRLVTALLLLPSFALAATSVTDSTGSYTHTWTLNGDYTVGQFWDGSWYVVDPGGGIQVTDLTWKDDDGADPWKNGSMLNPEPGNKTQHGFDSRHTASGTSYNSTLDVSRSLPIAMVAGDSLVTSKTYALSTDRPGSGYVEAIKILTVLSSAPASLSFRPHYHNNNALKKVYPVSAVDVSVFPDWSDVAGTPADGTYDDIEGLTAPLLEILTGGNGQKNTDMKNVGQLAIDNPFAGLGIGYGRGIGKLHTSAALTLCLDRSDAVKQPVAYALVQRGIDARGVVENGYYGGDGGHNMGRTIVLWVAAAALGGTYPEWYDSIDDAQVTTQAYSTHKYLTSGDISSGTGYTDPDDVGLAEWKSNGSGNFNADWNANYRDMNGSVNTPTVLIGLALGLQEHVGNDAYFDYITDRWWARELAGDNQPVGNTNGLTTFARNMYEYHISEAQGGGSPPPSGENNPKRTRLRGAASGLLMQP